MTDAGEPVHVQVAGAMHRLKAGEALEIRLEPAIAIST